ncbi:nitrate ABC transporter substrate-binding protein [Desulfobacter hydrogenophilus]|uniref:Nitrate ABC transporter substrate-binding protein n=1 Tax=Desulfobacter hydrogenophilus TaxID=2291 RepID=A0A328FBD0_9BACT|nr:ABC transporter substrate-binding protein [Desulfobacter hydrogenophilus]NDY74268.1 ABC transporter substrate-binding protein [Desulfobacter hydrogenophilus]QBH14600.1 nitrate ABC transporter substrate-binding protein [Desulfobacter hydrogenophilus]RAM00413.1 nitrate ABC transporter substrate-binding protein [Desulfobacter hydrogenophilus]
MTIRIGHFISIDHLILGIALPRYIQRKGSGADTDVIPFSMRSWGQVEKGFLSGDINAAFMDIAQAMYLSDKGLAISMLMFTHRAGSRIIVPEQIRRLADFKGKSVLIPHKLSIQHMLVHRLLSAGNLKIANLGKLGESVDIESVPYALMPEMANADLDCDIAAFICPAPFGDVELKKKGFRPLLISRDLWKDHPGSVFVVHQDLLKTKGKNLGLMVNCLLDSARQLDRYMASPDTAEKGIEQLSASFLGLSASQTQKALKTSGITYNPKLLVPDMKILNIVLDYMCTTMEGMPTGTDLHGFIRPEFIHTILSES